jgi:hypothetical protein
VGDAPTRSAREVLKHHLELRAAGELDRDLQENYHPDVVVMTPRAVLRGHDGVRESAHLLWRAVSDAGAYVYESVLCEDRMALLEWKARTEEINVRCGVDSYLIEGGLIAAQSIHYRVENAELSVAASTVTDEGELGPSSDDDPARMPEMVGRVGKSG